MKKEIRRIAILASGEGTTLQAVIDRILTAKTDGTMLLNLEIAVVISDNPHAFALRRAEEFAIPTKILKSKNEIERDQELYNILKCARVDLVVMLGYLKKVGPLVLSAYTVINTHPSLLPAYGGKGMHGMNVHKAVVAAGEKESGVTLHYANTEYDKGTIIWQTRVPVFEGDTPPELAERVQAVEKVQLLYILQEFSKGKIDIPPQYCLGDF